jgi:hypothetical protein
MKRFQDLLIVPTVVVWTVLFAIILRLWITDAWWLWKNRRRHGLITDADVTDFLGVLNGDAEAEREVTARDTTPLLHHSGEIPVSRLRTTPKVLDFAAEDLLVDGEDTVPMLPDGVHGFRIGHRPVEPVLVRSAPEPPAVATPIFDALALQWRTRADAVAFEWLTTLTEERRVEVAA